MAKNTRSTAKKIVAKGKAAANAKAVKKTSSTAKKPAAKPAILKKTAKPVAKAAKTVKPAAKATKPAAKPASTAVAKTAAKPAAKSAAKPAAKTVKPSKPVPKPVVAAAKPVAASGKSKPATVAAPASSKVQHSAPTMPSAAPAPLPAAPKPVAEVPVTNAVPAPSSKSTKLVITEESKKNSRKGVITPTASEAGITMEGGRYALAATTTIELPPGYRPASGEEYMNPMHLAFFRNKLREWRDQLVEESKQTIDNLREEVRDIGDEAERATRETENSLELRTRDRYRKLIAKIDKALKRIEEGRYGYCEETDEDIGIERLEARPIATLCLDAQERWEHRQRQMGD